MTQPIYGLYGASGFGRQVMPLARQQVLSLGGDAGRLVFVDDAPVGPSLNGHRVLSYSKFLEEPASEKFVVVAISDGLLRARLTDRCQRDGLAMWTVRAPNSVVTDDVALGVGAILSHFTLLTCNIRIGVGFQANHYSHVSHDCVIGDYVTFAPGVRCNGNILIEDYVYIGTGAVLKQGKPGRPLVIGRGAVVGMGAVVTKSVPAGATVVGNPARIMNKD